MRLKEENIEDRTLLQGIHDLLREVKGLQKWDRSCDTHSLGIET